MVSKVIASDTRQQLESRIKTYLKDQGYQVMIGVQRTGKSGVEHDFDMLAQSDDGFTLRTLAIAFIVDKSKESAATEMFEFANKTYDAGIKDRIIVAKPELDEENRQIAEKQRIKVVKEEDLESFLTSPATNSQVYQNKISHFENKAQLIDGLVNMGYRIEQNSKVVGRSGVEYFFDILAYASSAAVSHSLAIDILGGDREIGIERVAFFEAKAFDTGVDDKAIALLDVVLSSQARQFVEHQSIRVLELGKTSPIETVSGKTTAGIRK